MSELWKLGQGVGNGMGTFEFVAKSSRRVGNLGTLNLHVASEVRVLWH